MQLDFHYQQKTFIVAVSGGVDSVVLLHALVKNHPDNTYVVAHVNHGIRDDAPEDYALVRKYAEEYGLSFEYTELKLSKQTSEAVAREKRYAFLRNVAKKYDAQAIITAHHQDDVIETLFINLVRGTGRRGVASLKNTSDICRPLLGVPKAAIYEYAQVNRLTWREDSTNTDTTYLRNKIRHTVVADMAPTHRDTALHIIHDMHALNANIDKELSALLRKGLHKGTPVLSRRWFCHLPHALALEVVYILLRDNGGKDIDKKTLERVVVAIKTMKAGKTIQASGVDITLTKRSARFKTHSKTDENQV